MRISGFFPIAVSFSLALLQLTACRPPQATQVRGLDLPPKPEPKGYVCYRTNSLVVPDGVLDEAAWSKAPWTDYFTDIEGHTKPEPRFKTRAKMLWDDQNLYIAAEIEDPHVWARLKQRDTVIFYDNDFEVFIDPDGDTHAYYELEINALGTAWDLLLLKPYRDGGKAVNGWDIAGLRVGTKVNGTLNDPHDVDKGWTVEIVYPMLALRECAKDAGLPKAGDHWNIDFSRVEWRTQIINGNYRKEIDPKTNKPFPEDNWVWSPQGRINMHMPEMWGSVQFSSMIVGSGTDHFVPDINLDRKWALRVVYYAESEYFNKFKTYTSDLKKLQLTPADFPTGLPTPVIFCTPTAFESTFPDTAADTKWTIYQDSRIINLKEHLTK